ncbi:MAG: ABC transporter permease subunit [Bacteroidetes bacterium]|jgi:ABC-2 type transport system permease protein|nr:ABC transporter permease subunit [Bacteroidota bacterium]
MDKIWIIAKRELKTFFDSQIAYIMLTLFLGLTGFFTWIMISDVFSSGQASLIPFFNVAYWSLFFFIPAITMKMFAEEKRSGTLELLLTKAVSDWQVVLGKFLSVLMLIAIALSLSIPYYISITYLGDGVDHGTIWCGYLALMLMSAAYAAIGIWTSSLSNNQITAFLLALVIGILFHLMFGMVAGELSGLPSDVFYQLSTYNHFSSMVRGVIDTRDIAYFVALCLGALVLTEAALTKRHEA